MIMIDYHLRIGSVHIYMVVSSLSRYYYIAGVLVLDAAHGLPAYDYLSEPICLSSSLPSQDHTHPKGWKAIDDE